MTIPTDKIARAIPAVEIGEESPTALYRLFASNRKLLYVGITGDLKTRLAAHAETKPWWPEVARKTVEWHMTRASAAKAEVKVIRSERPLHNIRGFKIPEFRTNISGAEIVALADAKMPPTSLRLALLELAGLSTKEALDRMGVPRTNRYRVIAGRDAGIAKLRRLRVADAEEAY
jgi:predicted GIY-YIG superfamily endonuclease